MTTTAKRRKQEFGAHAQIAMAAIENYEIKGLLGLTPEQVLEEWEQVVFEEIRRLSRQRFRGNDRRIEQLRQRLELVEDDRDIVENEIMYQMADIGATI